jgi:transposase
VNELTTFFIVSYSSQKSAQNGFLISFQQSIKKNVWKFPGSTCISSPFRVKVWLEKGENRPQIVRTAKNSKKRMFVFFYTAEGVVARIVVQKGKTVNAELYSQHILPEVFSKFMEKRGRTTVRDVMLHHDNAAPHKAGIVTEYLKKERVKLLPHPPYSPDLAPCDFYLFPKIKQELSGRSFDSIENLSRAIQAIVDGTLKSNITSHSIVGRIG